MASGVWQTDGTPAGTVLLASLGPRPFPSGYDGFAPCRSVTPSSSPRATGGGRPALGERRDRAGHRAVVSGRRRPGLLSGQPVAPRRQLLFRACDGFDRSLWRSGGTFATTVPLAPTSASCSDNNPAGQPVAIGSLAYFTKQEGISPRQVWRTDGTDAGTFQLTHLTDSGAARPVAQNGKAVFPTYSDDGPDALWETDGTVAGTRKLFDFPAALYRVDYLTSAGSLLFFVGNDGDDTGDDEIWVSDGTLAGTRALTDSASSTILASPGFIRAGAWVYFLGDRGLSKSDGTPAGTQLVPLPAGEAGGAGNFFVFQGALYFTATTHQGKVGSGIWKTDGTAQCTVLVAPVSPPFDYNSRLRRGSPPSAPGSSSPPTTREHGAELWATDGTAAGTDSGQDIAPGPASSDPRRAARAGGRPPLLLRRRRRARRRAVAERRHRRRHPPGAGHRARGGLSSAPASSPPPATASSSPPTTAMRGPRAVVAAARRSGRLPALGAPRSA